MTSSGSARLRLRSAAFSAAATRAASSSAAFRAAASSLSLSSRSAFFLRLSSSQHSRSNSVRLGERGAAGMLMVVGDGDLVGEGVGKVC